MTRQRLTKHPRFTPQNAEKQVQARLEQEYGQTFKKKEIKVGSRKHKFDLVSEDSKIFVEVKSSQKKSEDRSPNPRGIDTLFMRYFFDCFLLSKTDAEKKIFFLVSDRELFEKFKRWSTGLIPQDIEIRHIPQGF